MDIGKKTKQTVLVVLIIALLIITIQFFAQTTSPEQLSIDRGEVTGLTVKASEPVTENLTQEQIQEPSINGIEGGDSLPPKEIILPEEELPPKDSVPPTPSSFWGNAWLNNSNVSIGDVVRAYDPQNVLCGSYTVDTAAWYGFLSCVGDDPATGPDEGAVAGDIINFTINGTQAVLVSGNATWVSGASPRADLNATPAPPPVDNPPYWSNNQTNIVLTYSPTTQSYFNITWQDDNVISIVYFESNYSGSPYNYTMNNIGGDVYNYSTILPAGTFYWQSHANDTTNQWNSSYIWSFIVSKATPVLSLTASPSWTETYGTATTINCSANTAEVTSQLYRNSTNIAIPDIQTLGAGTYNYVCNNSATQNYTANSAANTLTINKAATYVNLSLNGAEANAIVTYPNTITAIYSTNALTATMYRNGSDVSGENNTAVVLAVGTYNYTVVNLGNANYTSSSKTFFATVQQNTSSCSLTFNPTSPQTYGTAINTSCSCTSPEASASLYRNETDVTIENNQLVTLAAGDWNYVCNVSATQNHTAASNSSSYTINQADGLIYLYLNSSRANISIYNNTNVNISTYLIDGIGNIQVYKNGTQIYNGPSPSENITLFDALGLYNITALYFGNQNYTGDSETWWVNVTTVPDITPPYFILVQPPPYQYNQTQIVTLRVNLSENATVFANVSWDNTSQIVNLIYNGTNWYFNYSFINTTFPGQYNVTFNVTDPSGNSNTTTTYFVVNDVTPPKVIIVTPPPLINYTQGTDVLISANVTDPYYDSMDTVLANITWDATFQTLNLPYNVTTNLYEAIFNNTILLGQYDVTIIANDTSNNINDTEITIFFVVALVNDPPNTSIPIIIPAIAYTNNDLHCNATLMDNETVSLTAYWTWYKNGASILSGSTSGISNATYSNITTLLSGNTSKGENWICEVIPNDGTVNGTAKNSTQRLVSNTPPSTPSISLSPVSPNTTSDLVCTASGSTDLDSDTISYFYNWYNSTNLIYSTTNITSSSTLNAGNTSEGETWNCTATPYDGEENGTANSTAVVISTGISCDIALGTNWNFISLCLNSTNKSIEYVLSGLNYSFVMRWNVTSQQWVVWSPNLVIPPFTEFETNRSYFVYMSNPDTLTVTGNLNPNMNISLALYWTGAAYPYEFNTTVEKAFASVNDTYQLIQKWNNSAQQFMVYSPQQVIPPFTNMYVGDGMLIYENVTDTLAYNRSEM